jgi:catalase-peroxidase
MGPISRYLGPDVPKQTFIWQDPLPMVNYPPITPADETYLKAQILAAPGVTISNLVLVAWGSASTFRDGDKRGGANGARIALQPQASWPVNNPKQLQTVLSAVCLSPLPFLSIAEADRRIQLTTIKNKFNQLGSRQVSLADLIVLGGNAAIEKAAAAAGYKGVSVPFTLGRVDATQANTDVFTFQDLNPQGDGFRNFRNSSGWALARTEELLVDKAQQLTLTAPEMTVLVGGMRALNANYDGSSHGILTAHPGTLTNDFFTNILDINTVWTADSTGELFAGKDRMTGAPKWTATRADLIFSSHAELRAICEVYAQAGGAQQMVTDFVAAWAKVMNLDRFDVKIRRSKSG